MGSGIFGVDIPWFDELVRVDRLPPDNGSCEIRARGAAGGGKVSTALIAAARLGAKCALLAVLGDGARGEYLLRDFLEHGVDCGAVRIEKGYQGGFSLVLSDDASRGRRILWQCAPDARALSEKDVFSARGRIEGADFLHLCRMDAVDLCAARIARGAGVQVSVDADFYTPELAAQLPMVDICIASEEFFRAYAGTEEPSPAALEGIAAKGPHTVVVTLGGAGCAGLANGRYFRLPAYSEGITVVDTVGAGDVFHGAYLAGLLRGYAPEEAARYASATSAIKCTQLGGRAGIPTHEMVRAYQETGRFDAGALALRAEAYAEMGRRCI